MTRRASASALVLAAGFAWLLAGSAGAAALQIDYLYVDASEGGGSGGHVALALGDRVLRTAGLRSNRPWSARHVLW